LSTVYYDLETSDSTFIRVVFDPEEMGKRQVTFDPDET